MSKYFVTSQTTQTYPYTFADLRARPPQRRRTGFLLAGVALASAIFGGAAAYAFMATGDEPPSIEKTTSTGGLPTPEMSSSAIATPVGADGSTE